MTTPKQDFYDWLAHAMGVGFDPHQWQLDLALEPQCSDRLIRISTGSGKTLGVLLAWAFNHLARSDEAWPRRLVWCLPMRVLVEQTEAEVRTVLDRAGRLWNPKQDHSGKVGRTSSHGRSQFRRLAPLSRTPGGSHWYARCVALTSLEPRIRRAPRSVAH